MKVLVVVDSAKLQISLSSGLQDLGYTVDVVADGSEAIAYASSGEYDIIILDLTLPKNSSLLVLHELRESNREVEILILSQPDQIHDRVTGLIQGADDYLVKPFSIDDLHARIGPARALTSKFLRRQRFIELPLGFAHSTGPAYVLFR